MTRDRKLLVTFVIQSNRDYLGGTAPSNKYSAALKPSAAAIAFARNNVAPYVDGNPDIGLIYALIHIPFYQRLSFSVERRVDPQVFGYYKRTQAAVSEYERLNENRLQVQLVFAALYAVVSLLVLLASIWAALWAANRLVHPISTLIAASERVSLGDLQTQVPIEHDDDEIGTLGLAFNRMTQQLLAQRGDLVSANQQIDQRRRFTETVLSGVSAGVIGLDGDGVVKIEINREVADLLNAVPEDMEGAHYSECVPELSVLIRRAMGEPIGRAGGEVGIKRGGKARSLSVQVSSEKDSSEGFVVTFDDITDLVSAQRTAAGQMWRAVLLMKSKIC